MAAITINLSDARLERLQQLANQSGVSPEELLTSSVENCLGDDEGSFTQSASYVLKKNAELYRRLA
ncbi:MAG: DNA-binding protein [Acaryochloridaceae cyanobacterium RU_4_10]|nr:DNA-binding protein [Acaryochloridaceae cyanobacterium RU_4_10]